MLFKECGHTKGDCPCILFQKECNGCFDAPDGYSMNTEIYITGESLAVDIIYHPYGTADIKLHMVFGRNLKEGADNG